MPTHLDHLLRYVPDLLTRRILDLGSGRGAFLVDVASRGGRAVGVEKSLEYIRLTQERAQAAGVAVEVMPGVAEAIPQPDASFGFANVCEVIEHVEQPQRLLAELYRVLEPGGLAYLSVPNRFSMRDQHFHLYLVNWLPRAWCNAFISLFGKHKDYGGEAGRQNLRDMHYYTFGKIVATVRRYGFEVADMRTTKINRRFTNPILRAAAQLTYRGLRPWYFDSFHLLLTKPRG